MSQCGYRKYRHPWSMVKLMDWNELLNKLLNSILNSNWPEGVFNFYNSGSFTLSQSSFT